jgi:hypothetical protein
MNNVIQILNASYPSVRIPLKTPLATRTVKWDGMTDETLAHLVFHGVKAKTSDSFSVFKGTNAEKLNQAQKVLDNLEANDLRADRESDPVQVELKKLAAKKVSKARPENVKVVDWAKSDEAAAIWKEAMANPKFLEAAKARVAEDDVLIATA